MKIRKRNCGEMDQVLEQVEASLQNAQECSIGCSKHPVHKKVVAQLETLVSNEIRMGYAAKELVDISASLSGFDVGMNSIATRLTDFAQELAILSESNLAIIEETTASMNNVSDIIDVTTDTLHALTKESMKLTQKNDDSKALLLEVTSLKEDVIDDVDVMNEKIEQLVNLATEVGKIVDSVQGIANQTNLLALNAAIEAARAGEHGKGFAVVAEEVRNLADDTKQNLEGMRNFVEEISVAANESQESLQRSLTSTTAMGEKIGQVSDTIHNNIAMLHQVTSSVNHIDDSMQEIRGAAQDINNAMENTSEDAQRLSEMTQIIKKEAEESVIYAGKVEEIDDSIALITQKLFVGLMRGRRALTNEEVRDMILKAKIAHHAWLENMQRIVEEMHLYPIQVNDKKCAFGHFYHAVTVEHPTLKADWNAIDELHHKFHTCGAVVIEKVKENDREGAILVYEEAKEISVELLLLLDKVENIIKTMMANQERIFE